MAELFRSPQKPTRLNQVQINQSVQGYALAVVMGKGKIQQTILWTDGFSSKKVAASGGGGGGGKGIGGGKGGTQYLYSSDVIAALCNGPVNGVGDVWSGQSWLSNTAAAETYTISGSTPTYTPVNAGSFAGDGGVGEQKAYSDSFNDLGAPGSTVLAGTHIIPFRRLTFGAALNTGDYSIDPSNGNYHFSAADVGRTVNINYVFSLGLIKQQQTDLVPSGLTIQVGGSVPFSQDGGVLYASGPNEGKAFTRVSGTPSAVGTYSVSGSAPATYRFASADVNAEVLITYKINNTSSLPQGEPKSLAFTLFEGAQGQSPWSLLESNYPGAALGYTEIAYVTYAPMDLGFGAQIQQNVFEVLTADGYGGGIVDCNPVQCILQVLTNKVWGLGAGAVPFPISVIDNGTGGTWGSNTPGVQLQDGSAFAWFAANSFFISPVIDRQDTGASLIGKWLEAGQVAAFMSEGLLKLVPYGDTSTAGNGAIWTAPSAFAAALDDTCFVQKNPGQDPVRISSTPWQDAYNVVQVQWDNRTNQYAPEITSESDQAAINRYGSRIEDPQTWDFITTLPAATFAASMRVKRNVYTRNTYEFTLPYTFSYLEPMDVVDITTSSVWAAGLNNSLGIVNLPVRITRIVDNPDGTLDITAEDYPFGVHQPTIYNKDLAAGQVQPNIYADPGNSEVVMFEATDRLTGYKGNEIWIGACGTSDDWGSCNVWASMDGMTYRQVGTIETPARLGALGAAFASAVDPDTVNSLVIDLAENCAALESGTNADADQDNTLCFVDGELISYSAMTVTGQQQYTASGYIRRGRMGSSINSHPLGGLFLRLDDAVFKYTYDPSWAGKTLSFKFQSVNNFGNSAQDLSSLTATSFTVPGLNPGTVDAASGIIIDGLAAVPDSPASSRFAVLAIDSNRRPIIDYTGVNHIGTLPPGRSDPYLRDAKNVAYNRSLISITAGTIIGRGPCADSVDSSGANNEWTVATSSLPASCVIDLGAICFTFGWASISAFFVTDARFLPSAGSIDLSRDNVTWETGKGSWSGQSVDPIVVPLSQPANGARYVRINMTGAPINPAGQTATQISNVRIQAFQGGSVVHADYNIRADGNLGLPLNSRLNAGRPVIDLAEPIHANVNTDHIGDATGSPLTGGRRSTVALTASNNLASGIRVGGDSGIVGDRVLDVILDNSGAGVLKPVRVLGGNIGNKFTSQTFASGAASSAGWNIAATKAIDVPPGTNTISFNFTIVNNGGAGSAGFNVGIANVGFSITSGAAPATPQASGVYSGAGFVGVTLSNPLTGSGLTLSIYVNNSGGSASAITVNCSQNQTTPFAPGAIT